MELGLIGLGNMGGNISRRLMRAGHRCVVFDTKAETRDALKTLADDVICAVTPEPFHAVGLWYDDFSQTTDDEVRELLERSHLAARS